MTLLEFCQQQQDHHLISQWNTDQNGSLTPATIPVTSHKRIYWICAKGHVWDTELKDRVKSDRRSECPYCAGKLPIQGETDLATQYPEVAKEWHPTRNGEATPSDITVGSNKIYWWQCAQGHEWKASVENRTLKGTVCPYCSGKKAWPGFNDLATEYPRLMQEWSYEHNTQVDPTRIRPHSRKRVYWQCAEGHVWNTFLFNRTSRNASGCPVCAGRVKTAEKQLQQQKI